MHELTYTEAAVKKTRGAKSKLSPIFANLGDIRRARGMSQREVAESTGLTQPAISKIEGKDNLQLDTLKKYASGLGGLLELRVNFPDGKRFIVKF